MALHSASHAPPLPLFTQPHPRPHSPAFSSKTSQSYSTLFASGLHNDVDELGRRAPASTARQVDSSGGKKKGFLAKTLGSLVGHDKRGKRERVQMPPSPPVSPRGQLRPPRRPRSASVQSGNSTATGTSGVSGEGKAARVLGFASQSSLVAGRKADRVLGMGGVRNASSGSLRSAKESLRSFDERTRPPPRAPDLPPRVDSLPIPPPSFPLPAAPATPRSLSPSSHHSRGPPSSWRSPSPFTISDRLSWSAQINIGQAALEELEQKELRRARKPNPISWYTSSSQSDHGPPATWYSDHTASRPASNRTSIVEEDEVPYPFAPSTTHASYASFPVSTFEPDDPLVAPAPISGAYSFLSSAPPPFTHWSPSSTPTSSLRRPSLPTSPTRSHTPLSPTRPPPLPPFTHPSLPPQPTRQRTNTLISSASSGTRRYQRSNALNALEGRPALPRPTRRPVVETRASKPFLDWSDDDDDEHERPHAHPYQRPGSVQSSVSMSSFRSAGGEIDLFPNPPIEAGTRRREASGRSGRKGSEDSFLRLN